MQSDDLIWLLAVARAGSLTAAAKQRGVAVSTAARRLAALEASLGVRLIDRRINGSQLTRDGQRIAALAEPVVEGAARIERAAATLRDADGKEAMRISATEFVVSEVLAPALPKLWAKHPSIAVTLQTQADVVSLAARDADIAIRMTRPEGNSLIAKKLPAIRLGLFASKTYLAGRPVQADQLRAERFLIYDDSYGRLPELDWVVSLGLERSIALRTGSTRALMAATIAGAGIALLPAHFAERERLIAISTPFVLPPRTPWIVVHQDLRRDTNIKAAHAWINNAFAEIAS